MPNHDDLAGICNRARAEEARRIEEARQAVEQKLASEQQAKLTKNRLRLESDFDQIVSSLPNRARQAAKDGKGTAIIHQVKEGDEPRLTNPDVVMADDPLGRRLIDRLTADRINLRCERRSCGYKRVYRYDRDVPDDYQVAADYRVSLVVAFDDQTVAEWEAERRRRTEEERIAEAARQATLTRKRELDVAFRQEMERREANMVCIVCGRPGQTSFFSANRIESMRDTVATLNCGSRSHALTGRLYYHRACLPAITVEPTPRSSREVICTITLQVPPGTD